MNPISVKVKKYKFLPCCTPKQSMTKLAFLSPPFLPLRSRLIRKRKNTRQTISWIAAELGMGVRRSGGVGGPEGLSFNRHVFKGLVSHPCSFLLPRKIRYSFFGKNKTPFPAGLASLSAGWRWQGYWQSLKANLTTGHKFSPDWGSR